MYVCTLAHEIRNKNTRQFRATCALSAQRRWCLTGTPIQNGLDDIAALFQYLQVYPVSTSALFKRNIIAPLKFNDPTGDVTIGMRNLRLLLTTYCLRRKQSVLPQLVEQRPTEIVRTLNFTSDEQQAYKILQHACSSAHREAVSTIGRKASISRFQSIMRLRLFCNHGAATTEVSPDDSICTICGVQDDLFPDLGISNNRFFPACRHLVCVSCSLDPIGSGCPLCQAVGAAGPMGAHYSSGHRELQTQWSGGENQADKRYSTKINALLKDIENDPQSEKRFVCSNAWRLHFNIDRLTKSIGSSIVFSSWVRSLEMIEKAFKSRGIGYVLIDGRLNREDRRTQLKRFQEDPQSQILLMTTGTGAAG